jgi:hypothetical protein
VNVIEKAGKNRFKFIKSPTIGDIRSIGKIVFTDNALNKRKNKPNNKSKNAEQMTMETPKVNVITTDSDEFARQAMAYLESKGFKVTKEKLTLPVVTYKGTITSVISPLVHHMTQEVGKMEIKHIMMAYDAGRSCKYNTPEEYMKNEYNDFTS